MSKRSLRCDVESTLEQSKWTQITLITLETTSIILGTITYIESYSGGTIVT